VKHILREEHQPIRIVADGTEEGMTGEQLELLVASWRATTGRDPGRAFEYGQGFVKPTNWAGSLSAGEVLVEVVPRGALALGEGDRQKLDANLGEMLHMALGAEPLSIGEGEVNLNGSRFERAVEALCELVLAARRGRVLRAYRVREETTRTPKGTLRFPAQAVVALQRPGLSACRWVELSEDIPENRFLKAVLSLVQGRVGGGLRRRVDEALVAFEQASEAADPMLEHERIELGRLPREYAEAIELGKSLLEGRAAGILAGSLVGRSELVFLPDLFQGFLGRIAQGFATARGMECHLEKRGRHLSSWRSGPFAGSRLVELIPDVELARPLAAEPDLILDAKWKAIFPASPGFGITASDVHQMAAYALRLGCRRTALAYPWLGERSPFEEDPVMEVESAGGSISLTVIAVPLLWEDHGEIATALAEKLDGLLAA
jgi:5-methylcytosine-specific restriction enzyme subunit McrC